eukprot:gnl/TRDRNA2_/TRDRNA2_42786_c0_seq2.p1 gnl/TRDRNA2_/TRDRNA2_42786_c0~~gnl/TRDRNA2_/TRDRNA2_42786_c0_seq2.p1  ORF type:complete len:363 (-),score=80.99 gnl/TRDRNA2_/TRDRNA2_42786_c0_seq2:217-1269(-)
MESSGEDPFEFLDAPKVARIRRFGEKFTELIQLAQPNIKAPGWQLGENDEIGLSFAYRIDGEQIQIACRREFKGVDALQALVGYAETDLRPLHVKTIEECNALAYAADLALWHDVEEESDHIVQVDFVNALDEPLGALAIMLHSCPDKCSEFPEVCIPAPTRESRPTAFKQCCTFTPVPGKEAFLLHWGFVKMVPGVVQKFIGNSPAILPTRVVRSACSIWPVYFEQFLEEFREELIRREVTSIHSAFYDLARASMEAKASQLQNLGVMPLATVPEEAAHHHEEWDEGDRDDTARRAANAMLTGVPSKQHEGTVLFCMGRPADDESGKGKDKEKSGGWISDSLDWLLGTG